MHRRVAVLVLALVSVLLAGACAGEPEATIVSIQASEFAFTAPQSFEAGLVKLEFTNIGQQSHHLVLTRLDQGKTRGDLGPALAAMETEGIPSWLTFVGGAGEIAPGGSSSTTEILRPGTYALLCLIPDPADGVPHVAKGMIASITVTGDVGDAELPEASGTVRLKDFSFQMPAISSGELTLRVINDGPQLHEFVVYRLAPGKTVEDVTGFFSAPAGPPPSTPAGGTNAYSVAQRGNVHLNLAAGNYVAICFVPDANTGAPHFALGMVQAFTVQ
jgi:hypothetical protein